MRITIIALLLIGCLTACSNQDGGNTTTTNTNTTTTQSTSTSTKSNSTTAEKPSQSPNKPKSSTSIKEDLENRKQKALKSYPDDIYINRAFRSAELYCKCSQEEGAEAIASCKDKYVKSHERKMGVFPPEKAKVYDKEYQKLIGNCKLIRANGPKGK